MVEGLVAEISPEIDILDIAIPFVKSNNKFYYFNDISLENMLINSYNFTKFFKSSDKDSGINRMHTKWKN